MIQESYVTFEQAKALEELGFPMFYMTGDLVYLDSGECCYEYEINEDTDALDKIILCPTLSLVQKWLREEKDLHVFTIHYISRSNNTEWYSCEIDSKNFDKAIRIDNEENGGCFDKYEDALSAGIDKCIELLING